MGYGATGCKDVSVAHQGDGRFGIGRGGTATTGPGPEPKGSDAHEMAL